MQKQNYEIRVSIIDLWRIFVSKIWLIALAALIAGAAMYTYSYYTYDPVYKAVSKIYVLRQSTDENQSSSGFVQDLNAALTTVNDCKLIIKSETTMTNVITDLGLDVSNDYLLSCISLSSTDDSRIINITVSSSDAEMAKAIANSTADKGVDRIYEVMGIEQASIMEHATTPTHPSNSVFSVRTVLVMMIAAIIVYVAYLIAYLCDDTFSEPEEVSAYLSLTVLGIIPNDDEMSSKKKYRKYSSYYKSKKYYKTYEQPYKAAEANSKAKTEVKK